MEKAITKLFVPNTQCQDFLLAGVLNEITCRSNSLECSINFSTLEVVGTSISSA